MLELYNDRLIDLLAPHGKEVSFDRKKEISFVDCYCELFSLHEVSDGGSAPEGRGDVLSCFSQKQEL